jgi:hypothetical protein
MLHFRWQGRRASSWRTLPAVMPKIRALILRHDGTRNRKQCAGNRASLS